MNSTSLKTFTNYSTVATVLHKTLEGLIFGGWAVMELALLFKVEILEGKFLTVTG